MKSLAVLALVLLVQVLLAVLPQASSGAGQPPSSSPGTGAGNTIYSVWKPDLVIHEMTNHNGHAVRVAIRNRGNLDAGASWLRVRFASAELGVRYAWQQVPPIRSGFVYDFAFSVEEAVYEGDIVQSIEAHADYYNQVDERYETNNVKAVSSSSLF